jgi:hypothetical protein
MNPIRLSKIASLLAVTLLGGLPSTASAATRKFHPSACQVKPGSTGTLDFDLSSGQATNIGSGQLTLWCPLINDDVGLGGAMVKFQGWSAGCGPMGQMGVRAHVCYSAAAGGNTLCGSFAPFGSCPGQLVNPPPLQVPAGLGSDDFPYLEVIIQAPINGGNNTFFGYTVTQ